MMGLGNLVEHQLTLPFTGPYNNSLLHRRRLRAFSCHKLEESLSCIFSSHDLREHESRLVMLGHDAHSFTCIAEGVCWRVQKLYEVEFLEYPPNLSNLISMKPSLSPNRE